RHARAVRFPYTTLFRSHISALSEKFVKEPRDVVRVGQTVKVKVQEVDVARKRIALTMRLNDDALPARRGASGPAEGRNGRAGGGGGGRRPAQAAPAPSGAMAEAFAKLKARQ